MSILLQNLICGLLVGLALLGLARSYGLLGKSSASASGCAKGCGACQAKLAESVDTGTAPAMLQLQKVRRFKLH